MPNCFNVKEPRPLIAQINHHVVPNDPDEKNILKTKETNNDLISTLWY